MLNRINELNVIESFYGCYSPYKENNKNSGNSKFEESLYDDKILSLKANYRKSEKTKSISCTNQDGNYSLFWGELYNFNELTRKLNMHQDEKDLMYSELCLKLYSRYGADFCRHLNGIFCLILYDKLEKVFLIAVDRYGTPRPIYYRLSDKLTFGTRLRYFFKDGYSNSSINIDALALFLKYSYIPSPKTIINGVNKLNPGEMILCKRDRIHVRRYIDFNIIEKKISISDAVDHYMEIYEKSMKRQLDKMENQKIGILLSGGLDSSANVAIASKLKKCDFETFGIGFEDKKIDERPFAKLVAENFGVPFNDYVFSGNEIEFLPQILWHIEEPFLENGLFLTFGAFKSAQDNADIVISGNCVDQLYGTGGFAGGRPIALRYLLEIKNILPLFKFVKKITNMKGFYSDNLLYKSKVLIQRGTDFNDWFFWGYDDEELKKLCNFDFVSRDIKIFSNNLKRSQKRFSDYYQYALVHQDIEHYACQNILVKSYRLAEMFGIIERDPFLDYEMVDFLLGLEIDLKRRGKIQDYLRNKTVSKVLHRIAMNEILPERILKKPKQGGFVSMELLLNDNWKRVKIYRYILRSKTIKEYFNMNFVNNIINYYEAIIKKKKYWPSHRDSIANKVLYLLAFAVWHDYIYVKSGDKQINEKLTTILEN